jgi:large subunit ribosomal protein L21
MYAVIETGGKQYRVEVGTELEVELLEAEAGQSITLERVLLVADDAQAAVGTPLVADAAVDAEVVGRERGEKVIAFKYRPKARRRVKKGHRQERTVLRVADIRYQGKSAAEGVATTGKAKATDRKRLEEAAARQAAEDAALAAKLSLGTMSEGPSEEAPKPAKRTRAKAADAGSAEAGAAEAVESATGAEATQGDKAKAAAKPTRRRAQAKKADAASSDAAPADRAAADATPKAPPKRSRTKKD